MALLGGAAWKDTRRTHSQKLACVLGIRVCRPHAKVQKRVSRPSATYKSKDGIVIKPFECKRCSHTWYPRQFDRKPRMCPNCKTRLWDKAPKHPAANPEPELAAQRES